jgi:hypothetical protein
MKHALTHLTTLLVARSPGIYNLDACGKDYIVRNNHFGPQRRHALLARSSDGLFEGNLVVDQQSTTEPKRWSFPVKEAGN